MPGLLFCEEAVEVPQRRPTSCLLKNLHAVCFQVVFMSAAFKLENFIKCFTIISYI